MISGNQVAKLELKTVTQNEIGEDVAEWQEIALILGYLDMLSGSAEYNNYNAKIQESTHVFICDYLPIKKKTSELRLIVDDEPYEITLIDNPMNLNKHLEFYLKFLGD